MNSPTRRLRLLVLYAALSLPLVLWGASRALEANNNSPIDWVSASFPPRAEYDRFCEKFGPGDTVMLSWPDCTIHEASLDELLVALRTSEAFFQDGHWLFDFATSGREAVALLTRPPDPDELALITTADSARRLESHLIGADGVSTAVVITFNAEGLRQRGKLVDYIRQAAHDLCEVPQGDLHLAGPVIDGLSVDQASQSTLSKYAAPSALLVLLLCWLNLRSFRAAVVVFGLAMFCQGATLALVYYSGETMSALLIVLPPLIQVLAVAGGVHLTNYYFDQPPEGSPTQRLAAAIRQGWLPCALSAGTTAIGLGSLLASGLEPIRAFGGYAAAGVLLTVGVLLGLLPALYLCWPPRSPHRPRGGRIRFCHLPWHRWTDTLQALGPAVVATGLLVAVVGIAFATRISTSVRIETMFAADHRVITDYRWLEARLGPLVPLEVTLSFDPSSRLDDRDKLLLLWRLGERLEADPAMSRALSAANCFPPIEGFSELPLDAQRKLIHEVVSRSFEHYSAMRLARRTDGVEHWRLTTRTSALGTADYGEVLARVAAVVDAEVERLSPSARQGLTTSTTGIMPLVHAIQGQLLWDLLKSFAAALVLITLVITLVQAGVLAGLVAMIPNVFPLAIFFGVLGWWGQPIDIGVVMTASLALGVAVDDTLHFLTFFHGGVQSLGTRRQAVAYALAHCGPAMIQTSVSCGLGLLVFTLSDFLPTSRFASSMAVLLALALLGDLVLLPALLLGPLGSLCVPQIPASDEPQPVAAEPANSLDSAAA